MKLLNKWERFKSIFMIVKYLFSVGIVIASFCLYRNKLYLVIEIIELFAIICISDLLVRNHRILAHILNDILLLLFNVQILILIFGTTYLNIVYLENMQSIQDLAGKGPVYIILATVGIILSFLPISPLPLPPDKMRRTLSFAFCVELFLTLEFGNTYSPVFGYVTLAEEYWSRNKIKAKINAEDNITANFYRGGLTNAMAKPENVVEEPNVVLIFTEGLSQNIVDDPRDIMPTVAQYEQKSLNFINYYNHTFATYRGIIGQLYSGYQLNNYDSNTLISLQDIFKNKGYYTGMINTEPNNRVFTNYLESMGFDETIGQPDNSYHGMVDSMSDKEAYDILFELMQEKSENGHPFFLCVYTFGTHVSLDSTDEIFGDGSDAELNKFYNLDYQFSSFMNNFNASDMAENTIIIFTADHCTYRDAYYNIAFPDYSRTMTDLDEMPLFIYYDGIEPASVDAAGRNSLDLAPTILDFLDMEAPNYFLGESLFMSMENNNSYDTVFFDGTYYAKSQNGVISSLSDTEMKIMDELIQNYFIASQQTAVY